MLLRIALKANLLPALEAAQERRTKPGNSLEAITQKQSYSDFQIDNIDRGNYSDAESEFTSQSLIEDNPKLVSGLTFFGIILKVILES